MKPSVGFLETSSLAKGIESLDAMVKAAEVEVLMTTMLPRGKYVIVLGGELAEIQSSMSVGLNIAGNSTLDHFIIQNVHEQIMPALKARIKVPSLEAVGIIETKEMASAIYAADAAVKKATVTLIEARNQPGGKGMVVLTGEVGAVRAAVSAGVETIKKDGMLVSQVVIPYAHASLHKALTS